jgi:surfeit locus 1 family protein
MTGQSNWRHTEECALKDEDGALRHAQDSASAGVAMMRLKQGLVIALGIILAAVMAGLGFWQLNVYHRSGEAAAERRAEAPPVPLSSVTRPGAPATEGFGRSVSLEGSYDPALQLLIPAENGRQFRVLTGLRLADGSVVAVVRGVVSAPTAPPPPSGQVQQVGVLLPTEEHLARSDLPNGQIASVRLPTLAQQWPGPLIDGFVTLSGADSANQGLAPAELQLRESPGRLRNGAYIGQWWLFAAFALFMAFRMARDIGVREAESETAGTDEITAEPSDEPT